MLRLDNVSFSYPNCCSSALSNVNLTVEEGSFIAILGSNGSGKSTLAKLLNAILVPSSGLVYIDGLDSHNKANIYAIRSKVGIVFQNPDTQIVCDTVEDEIAFGLENMGLPIDEMKKRIAKCLSLTGLESLRFVNPNNLSGGQKQMVCIASVLAMQPKYLVLDEATSMLDPQGRKLVLNFVESLHSSLGLTIIMITHSIEECIHANKVVVLHKGSVSFEGDLRALLNSYYSDNYSDNSKVLDSLRLPLITQLTHHLISKGLNLPSEIISVDDFCTAFTSIVRPNSKGFSEDFLEEGGHA